MTALRVAMLVSSGYRPKNRVQKQAHTLALAGCRVTVIAWDRLGQFAPHELEPIPAAMDRALTGWPARAAGTPDPVSVVRIQVAAGYRTGRQLVAKLPAYGWRLWHEVRRVRPDVIHAHDLDTLPFAYLYGRWAGIPVVYDAGEFYPGMVRASVGAGLSRALNGLDRWLVPRVDAVLTVGEWLAAHYRALGGRVWIVHNSQPLPDRDASQAAGRAVRAELGIPESMRLVVYVGMLAPDRLLGPVLEAVPRLDNVALVIGGEGPLMGQVEAAAARCERIRAVGWVPLADVVGLVAASDVVYYGLEVSNPNSVYFMPTLAFFALAVGRPLLLTPVGEIAEVARREGFGLVMDAPTAEAAERALQTLCDPARCAALAERAQACGAGCYHWGYAASQLWAAYEQVKDS